MSSVVPLQAGLLTLLPARHRVTVAFVNAPGVGAPDGGVGRGTTVTCELPVTAGGGYLNTHLGLARRMASLQ